MNKNAIGRQVADEMGLTYTQGDWAADIVFRCIADALGKGQKVTIAGHGTYEPVSRRARQAHNPQTGEKIEVPARTVPRWRPAQALKNKVASAVVRG